MKRTRFAGGAASPGAASSPPPTSSPPFPSPPAALHAATNKIAMTPVLIMRRTVLQNPQRWVVICGPRTAMSHAALLTLVVLAIGCKSEPVDRAPAVDDAPWPPALLPGTPEDRADHE